MKEVKVKVKEVKAKEEGEASGLFFYYVPTSAALERSEGDEESEGGEVGKKVKEVKE